MTFLFLSTIILTGPAWCSHLCYFGGIDNLVAGKKTNPASWQNKRRIKYVFFIITLLATFIFRLFHISSFYALAGGILAGVTGVLFMIFGSTRSGKMANCVLYCPVGTLVSYIKYVNPFRMKIHPSCTLCGKCSSVCRYDALNQKDIEKGKPGMTCTYCGDCIVACSQGALNYKFFNLSPTFSRNLYLFLTVSFHVVFLALARI
jgi:polyferredoxin